MPTKITPLVVQAQHALRLSQMELGELLGSSRRTGQRWGSGKTQPGSVQLQDLARHVFPVDPELAAEIAGLTGSTLVSLGLVAVAAPAPVPVPAPVPADRIVDTVVCAAAEAMGVMPSAIRPALLAALARAREVGLTMDAIEDVLARPPRPSPARVGGGVGKGKA